MSRSLPDHELLSAYLDDELSLEDRARVEKRLETDAEYAAELESFRDQQQRLQALPKSSIDVRQCVMEAVNDAHSEVANNERKSSWQSAAWVIASLAAVLLVGLFLYQPEQVSDFAMVQNEATLDDEMSGGVGGAELSLKSSAAADIVTEQSLPADRSSALDSLADDGDSLLKHRTPAAERPGSLVQPSVEPMAVNPSESRSRSIPAPAFARRDKVDASSLPAMPAEPTAESAPSASGFAAPSADDYAMKFKVDQQPMLDLLEMAGVDTEERSIASSSVDGGSEADDFAIEGLLKDATEFKRLDEQMNRSWYVRPKGEQSDVRLTLELFRNALSEAGCAYQEEKALRPLSEQSAMRKQTKQNVPSRNKEPVEFIVVATPEQLVRLRDSLAPFFSIYRLDLLLRAIAVERQEEWDGSMLPSVKGLDPPGDGRMYQFSVYPEKQPAGDQ
jgi:anti-sigma factor RsiW